MPNDDKKRSVVSKFLANVGPIVTGLVAIATCVIGFKQCGYEGDQLELSKSHQVLEQKAQELSEEQHSLNEQLESRNATNMLTDAVYKYLETLSLADNEKKDLIVSLVAILTEANLTLLKKDNFSKREEYLELLPLQFALVTNNAEMLSHIGANESKRKLWVSFSGKSGNVRVKSTAIQALERIAKASDDPQLFKETIVDILELSKNGRIAEVTDDARNALINLSSFFREKLEEDKELSVVLNKAIDTLAVIATETPATTSSKEEMSIEKGWEEIKNEEDAEREKMKQSIKTIQRIENIVTPEAEKLPAKELEALAEKLVDKSRTARLESRKQLTRMGQPAVAPLLKALEKHPDDHKMKLGISASFLLMGIPLEIPAENIEALVQLVYDDDARIRQNTASVMYDIKNEDTVDKAVEVFVNRTTLDESENGVFNSVKVLCEWYIRKPRKGNVKNALVSIKGILKGQGDKWANTITMAKQCLGEK